MGYQVDMSVILVGLVFRRRILGGGSQTRIRFGSVKVLTMRIGQRRAGTRAGTTIYKLDYFVPVFISKRVGRMFGRI